MAGSTDLLKLAVGAVSVVGVGLFLWGWRDVRDVFEDSFRLDKDFGDWPHVPDEGKKAAARPETGGEGLAATSSGQGGRVALHSEGER